MCSNSGRPEAFFQPEAELLRRVEFLHGLGVRRVVVTGGEPSIHPAFWAVVQRLGECAIAWDINTHGRRFADPAFTDRAVAAGLHRAIVSLHSHDAAASRLISGVSDRGHAEIVGGIDQLRGSGVQLMINCVLTTANTAQLPDFVDACCERWGTGYVVKVAFPSATGKGGGWEGIRLRYSDVQAQVLEARRRAEAWGLDMAFESFPNCILGDVDAGNLGRSGFGETHYLDDIRGDRLYPIAHIEAELSTYPDTCRGCRALPRCPGIAETYARTWGASELVRFD